MDAAMAVRCPKMLITVLVLFIPLAGANLSWYQGCFIAGPIVNHKGLMYNKTLPKCSLECTKSNYEFTAIRGLSCKCVDRLSDYISVPAALCNVRCRNIPDGNLPCGRHSKGQRLWSVYRSDGPFIAEVDWKVDASIVELGIPVTVEAKAVYQQFVDITKELIVKNAVSSMTVKFPVTVSTPSPRWLQVAQLDDPMTLPSCVPRHRHLRGLDMTNFPSASIDAFTSTRTNASTPGVPDVDEGRPHEYGNSNVSYHGDLYRIEEDQLTPLVLTVFANHSTRLEIAVASGVNLTFDLMVWVDGAWDVRSQRKDATGCKAIQECRHVVLEYFFKFVGVYPIQIRVHNKFGEARRKLIMVALDRHMHDMSLHALEIDSGIANRDRTVNFRLSSITALRQGTFLSVDFGDGIGFTTSVRQKKNSTATSTDKESPRLISTYGDGCNLSLGFTHMYRQEGRYTPVVKLYNNVFTKSVRAAPLTVMMPVRPFMITGEYRGIAGQDVYLSLGFHQDLFSNYTAEWSAEDSDGDVTFTKVITLQPASSFRNLNINIRFDRPGLYVVFCRVSNHINAENDTKHVMIQEAVNDVHLSCINEDLPIRTNEYVTCLASCARGSQHTFLWDLKDEQVTLPDHPQSDQSNLTHAFRRPGVYNITVTVSNAVSSETRSLSRPLKVQSPVEKLQVMTPYISTYPDDPFAIIVLADGGTDVVFDLDIDESGRRQVEQRVVDSAYPTFSISWSLSTVGVHNVTVWAYNGVSEKSHGIKVNVQLKVPPFRVKIFPLLDEFSHFRLESVNPSGDILYRPDLIYKFSFSDKVVHLSQVPIIARGSSFPTDGPPDFLDVSVCNDASGTSECATNVFQRRSLRHQLQGFDNTPAARRPKGRRKKGQAKALVRRLRRKLVLRHPVFAHVGQVVSFQLINKTRDVGDIRAEYGDKRLERVTCKRTRCDWVRRFASVGLYKIDVSFYGKRSNSGESPHFRSDLLLQSVVVVEEPINGLRLSGPTLLETNCHNEWEIVLDSGSHLVIVWSVDGRKEEPTTRRKYLADFPRHGHHILHVKVFNDISTAEATLNVHARNRPEILDLDIPPTVLSEITKMSVFFKGDPPFKITFDFGDNSENFVIDVDGEPSTNEKRALKSPQGFPQSSSFSSSSLNPTAVPYVQDCTKVYKNNGYYTVTVRVDNGLSSVYQQRPLIVSQPIGEIQLVANTDDVEGHVLSDRAKLIVKAVVNGGDHLLFDWDFDGQEATTVSSNGNTSEARHSFLERGKYRVSVTVYSSLQGKSVKASLPYPVHVIGTITRMAVDTYRTTLELKLLPNKHNKIEWQTDTVKFKAKSSGSNVTFGFHFGDECEKNNKDEFCSNVEDKGPFTRYHVPEVKEGHIYKKEGVYKVRVVAYNGFGRQEAYDTEPIIVQKRPTGAAIEPCEEFIQLGQVACFNASVKQGTNVSFHWTMDDETELVDAGPFIQHQYRHTGDIHIMVETINAIDNDYAVKRIRVLEKITGVILSRENNITVIEEETLFHATVFPPSAMFGTVFDWEFFDGVNTTALSGVGPISYCFKDLGIHMVKVTARNELGSSDPETIMMSVYERVSHSSIVPKNDVKVNSPIKLRADQFKGNLQHFTWNFGDGTPDVTAISPMIVHTYERIGEYLVTLKVDNPVSSHTSVKRLFVLEEPCYAPNVLLLGQNKLNMDDVNLLQYNYSEAIHVEANVQVNCSMTSEITFNWLITDPATGREVNVKHELVDGERRKYDILRQPRLILPPESLQVGFYVVKLRVDMVGTNISVFAESQIQLYIRRCPLVAFIYGGDVQQVGRKDFLRLDGGGSYSPNDPQRKLKYLWICLPSNNLGDECFKSKDQKPLLNGSSVLFPASWLSPSFTEFVFYLSVWHPDSDTPLWRHMANTSQVVYVAKDAHTIPITLECVQCKRHHVNSYDKVSLRTYVPNNWNEEMEYEWSIEMIYELHHMQQGNKVNMYCFPTATATTINSKHSSDLSASTRQKRNIVAKSQDEDNQQVSPTNSGKDPHHYDSRGEQLVIVPEISVGNPLLDLDEGGTASRNIEGKIDDSTPDEEEKDCDVKLTGDCKRRDPPLPVAPTHLIHRPRTGSGLGPTDTLTGVNGPSLVLKPNVLKQGRTYLVEVKSKTKDGSISGYGLHYMIVNRSPTLGKCTIEPTSGTALDTVFKIFCKEWEAIHNAVHYEVSFSVLGLDEGQDSGVVLYHGQDHEVTFRLPAGLAKYDHQVYLQVAIFDKFEARTLRCLGPIQVKPNPKQRVQAGSDLLRQSTHLLSSASRSVYDGLNLDLARILSQLSWQLNVFPPVTKSAGRQLSSLSLGIRQHIRNNLVDALNLLPQRNLVEVVQALRCLADVTDQFQELDNALILKTRNFLQDITGQVRNHVTRGQLSHGMEDRVLPLAVRVVSNVLSALADGGRLFRDSKRQERLYQSSSLSVMNALDQLLGIHLQRHSIGEPPVIVDSPFLSVNATHHHSPLVNQTPTSRGVSFTLPSGLALLPRNQNHQASWEDSLPGNVQYGLFAAGDLLEAPESVSLSDGKGSGRQNASQAQLDWSHGYDKNQHCIQSRAISYKANPFGLRPHVKVQVQTAIASLDLYTCNGSEHLVVENLQESDSVHIDFQRRQFQRPTEVNHYLNKTSMNVHTFGISNNKRYHHPTISGDGFLHIHIQLESLQHGVGFPIMVVISGNSGPKNVHKFIFKEVYEPSREDIKIFLSSKDLKPLEGVPCTVSIVEASFNSGRRHPEEVQGRSYNLSAWWDICVFWNSSTEKWTGDGCMALPSSSLDTLECSCNHLSTFGGFYEIVPHRLTWIDVEDFFGPHKNPVVVVLVGVVFLVYLAAVLMVRACDKKDSQKKKIVYLQDNMSSHHQKYEVILETGFHADAGTTSKISVILHGGMGVSETRELICPEENRSMFERNSRERFIITLPEGVGKIYKIQVWHSNSGSSPGWFLRHVIVRDLSMGQASYFLCQRWLAVDRDDGKVEREFLAIKDSDISFKQIFMCKGPQILSDFHTWLSIIACPPDSRFTRVQRLSVCLMLVMSYMAVNTVWYRSLPPMIRGEFALLDVSWYNIVIGGAVCLIFVPLNLLLGFLFRRSQASNQSRGYPYGQDKLGFDLASQCEEESSQPAVTYSILDQSILNWQHIQDWAHKQWLKRQQSVRSSANSVKTTQTSPQLSTTPLVQQTLLADDTDQGSSGFEDATSQATAERHRVKTTSYISFDGMKSRNVEQGGGGQNSRKTVLLPFWLHYVAWVLCMAITVAGGTVTIFYGWRFSHQRSVMWIQAVYFSLITCLFVVQPALVLMSVIFTSCCSRGDLSVLDDEEEADDFDLMDPVENQNKKNSHLSPEEEELQQGVEARSRSRYLRFAGPPQEEQLKSSRKKILKEKKALYLYRHTRFVLVFLSMVVLLAFGRHQRQEIHLNKSAYQLFVGDGGKATSFLDVKSRADWLAWAKHSLATSLSTMSSLTERYQGTAIGSELGLLVGRAQVRELKVNPEPCSYYGGRLGDNSQTMCVPDFSESVMATNYSESVMATNDSESVMATNDSDTPGGMTFQEDMRVDLDPGLSGVVTWYGQQGFVLGLNNTRSGLQDQFDLLENSSFFNHLTRAVFVEMTVYNPPTGLHCSITLLLELSATSNAFPSIHIHSSPLFFYTTLWEHVLLACELSLIMITMVLLTVQVRHLLEKGKDFFYNFWNYIEVLTSLTSLLYAAIFVYRFVVVMDLVEFLRTTLYEKFASFAFLALLNETLKGLLGIIAFCLMLMSVQLLGYMPSIARSQIALSHARREVLLAAGLFAGLLMAFSSLGHILFGTFYYPMSFFVTSVMTFTALSVRAVSSQDDLHQPNQSSWLAITFVFAYVLIHGLTGVYLFTVLSYKLKRVRFRRRMSMPLRKLVMFYWTYVRTWTQRSTIYAHPQPADNTLPPEFTMAEILYLVEELLFRMNALMGTSGLPDKHNSFSDSDFNQNMGDDGISSAGSDDHQFTMAVENTQDISEDTRLEHRVQKIEDKLCSNEPYLAQLLKLDSIGTDILSEEKEQELRSQLEFQIFHQLQMQRQETGGTDASPINSSPSAPLLPPAQQFFAPVPKWNLASSAIPSVTLQGLPGPGAASKTSPPVTSISESAHVDWPHWDLPVELTSKTKAAMDKDSGCHEHLQLMQKPAMEVDPEVEAELMSKFLKMEKLPAMAHFKRELSSEKSPKSLKRTHPLQPRLSAGKKPHGLRHGEMMERNGRDKEPLIPLLQYTSSGNASPQSSESERGHRRTDSSSGQDIGTPRMGSRIGHDRYDNLRGMNRRGDLPPRPTFTHTMLAHNKSKQFEFRPDLAAAESSSGSEPEVGFGAKRTSVGKRNLRKTKSRGKGKGCEVEIDSPMVLSADFPSSGSGVECDIVIHPIPHGVDLDDISIPE